MGSGRGVGAEIIIIIIIIIKWYRTSFEEYIIIAINVQLV